MFKFGYTAVTSFILVLGVTLLMSGVIKAPIPPSAPTPPTYPTDTNMHVQSNTQSSGLLKVAQAAVAVAAPVGEIQPSVIPSIDPVVAYPAPTAAVAVLAPYSNPNIQPTYDPRQVKYEQDVQKYQDDYKKHQDEQKNFSQKEIVPYLRNVAVAWVILVVVLELLGLVFAKMGMELAGGALSFSGVWVVVITPIWGLIYFVSSIASAFSAGAGQASTLSTDSITNTLGVVSLLAALILILAGIFFEKRISISLPRAQTPPQRL